MFPLRICSSAQCSKRAVYQRDTCYQHLQEPSDYVEEIGHILLRLPIIEYVNLSFVPFNHVDLTGKTIRFCLFSQSTWQDVRLDETQMDHVYFDFCTIKNCTFEHSRLLSVVFAASDIQEGSFAFSDLLHCSFIGITCVDSIFNESDLYASRFIRGRLERVGMKDCNLKRVDFTQTVLTEVDFQYSNTEDATMDQDPC